MILTESQKTHLQLIRSNHGSDVKRCCSEMFDYWINSRPWCNWSDLVKALKSPGVDLIATAEEIEIKFAGKIQLLK